MTCPYLKTECRYDEMADICTSCNHITKEELESQRKKRIWEKILEACNLIAQKGIKK